MLHITQEWNIWVYSYRRRTKKKLRSLMYAFSYRTCVQRNLEKLLASDCAVNLLYILDVIPFLSTIVYTIFLLHRYYNHDMSHFFPPSQTNSIAPIASINQSISLSRACHFRSATCTPRKTNNDRSLVSSYFFLSVLPQDH